MKTCSAIMLRLPHAVLLFGAILFMAGCGGTRSIATYDVSDNRTVFRSGPMTVARQSGSGYGSATSIVMRAVARCPGRDCTPERVQLTFSAEGSSDFSLSNRSVRIVADGEKYERTDATQWNDFDDVSRTEGPIAGLVVSLSALEQMATASNIGGTLGHQSLRLSGSVQSSLQAFVQSARNPATASSETS